MEPALADATTQAELLRKADISPPELIEQTIERIERLNPELNAVIIPLFEKARSEANKPPEGPFRGVPYLLKDLALVSEGDPTSQAMAGVKDAGYRADHDSYFVRSMREAGFVLVGKTNLDEMGMGASTSPAAWGPTRNPWDLDRSPGGSSGGSAAAVAARLVPVADATDASGSIRLPAAHCGVVGLKGSRGRVSVGPDVFSDNLLGIASEMCIARSIRDVAAILDVVAGHRPGDPYAAPEPERAFAMEARAVPGRLRVGVLLADPTGRAQIDEECVSAARKATRTLEELGHDVAEDHPKALADGGFPEPFMATMAAITARGLELWSERLGRELSEADVEPATWAIAQQGRSVSGVDYSRGVDALRARGREIERWWQEEGWDLLLTPTTPTTAPRIGEPPPPDAMTFTVPFNVSGQPAISLPLGTDGDGLPVGVQLVAAYGREDRLLQVASQLEEAMPWVDRWPPLST